MAYVANSPYPDVGGPEVFFSQYRNWKQVTLPTGEVVYEVPGHPERVFIPSLSHASGRVVLRENPANAIAAQKEKEDAAKKAQEQQQFNQSLPGQLIPIGASVGGTVLAGQAATGTGLFAPAATGVGAGTAAGAGGAAAGTGAVATPTIVGAQLAGGTGATGAAAGTGGATAGTAGVGAGTMAGAAALGALYANNVYESGGKEVAQGKGKSADYVDTALAAVPLTAPFMWGARQLGFSPGEALFGSTKSTKQIQGDHTRDLLEQAKNDPAYQQYVQGMRAQNNEGPPDPSKPFAGKYKSWDEYKAAGLEAGDLTGVYGNIKTYGPAWASLTQEQRQAVTQANIDSNLYSSKKGEVEITDAVKAKQNYDNVMKGFQAGVQTTAQAAAQGVAPILPGQTPITTAGAAKLAPLQPGQTAASTAGFATGANPNLIAQAAAQGAMVPYARTSTRSPGIGLDGRRIVY